MGTLTNYAELKIIDHLLGTAYTPPSTIYVALCTADPGEAATGASMSEVANSNGYARAAITFGAAASRVVTQSALLTMAQATGAYSATHWALVDSATHGAGNALAYGALDQTISVVATDTPKIASGQIHVDFTAGFISTYAANKMLDLMFRNVAYTAPATYVTIVTTNSSDTAVGTEPSGNGFARKLVNPNGGSSPTWDLASAGASSNTHTIVLGPPSGGGWGTPVGTAIMDASTSGNLLLYANGLSSSAINDGDDVEYAAGALDITLN